MRHDIPAVVLDLSATGIGIVRSLRKKGIKVYAFDIKGKYEIGKTAMQLAAFVRILFLKKRNFFKFLTKSRKKIWKETGTLCGIR